MIRPMATDEDEQVRKIYRACHPTWPEQPAMWYEAHPTLVCEMDGAVVGYCSYALVLQPEISRTDEVMVGYGCDVAPSHHGRGIGRALCDERLTIARAVGARTFVGHSAHDNSAMRAIFERDGLKPFGDESRDPDGRPIAIYMGPIR